MQCKPTVRVGATLVVARLAGVAGNCERGTGQAVPYGAVTKDSSYALRVSIPLQRKLSGEVSRELIVAK
ncbi:MAG: hypothetical protein OXU77_09465 [Gammaproteobacteria bacterium]|nr:hypothetical protein [Gammaproteobacteria bacterium]